MNILELIEKADQALAEAENLVLNDYETSVTFFRSGITKLCQAYLLSQKQTEFPEDLLILFQKCLVVNSEFEEIAVEFELFFGAIVVKEDPEILIDIVNEIWDFIVDLIPEFEG